MARLSQHGLRRVLGTSALFSTAYGNVGSSIYYALGLVASFALGLTPVVFVITGVIFYLTAATYAEATAMFPEAGGSSSFARHAFNELWSFFAAWAQMLNYTITIAISAFFVPHYVGGLFWPALLHGPGDVLFGIGVVGLLSVVNVVGVKEAAGLNIVLAITDLATQFLLVAVGIALVLSPHVLINNVNLGVAPSWKNFLVAIPVGMIAYTGIETISNMAEEARDETKTIPRAIKAVVAAVFAIYAALPLVALSALPVHRIGNHYTTLLGTSEAHGGFAGDPVLGIVKHLHLGPLQSAGEIYVGLLASTILFIAANAGIIGASRLIYSMGLHRQVPGLLSRLHPRFSTPWLGILLFGGVACLTIIPGKAEFLGNMYAFGAMLSFTVAHVSVIRLRVSEPDRPRPYRGPGTITIAGRPLPVFALLGMFGTGLAFITVTILHLGVAAAGIAWLALGIGVYVIYRRRHGLDLRTTTLAPRHERPPDFEELEYRTALVPIFGDDVSASALNSAAKLIGPQGVVYAVYVLPVPSQLSLDAGMEQEEAHGRSVLESARIQAKRSGIKIRTDLIRTRNPGASLVQEATRIDCDVIYWSAIHAPAGEQRMGPTATYLLSKRPCRVIIETQNRQLPGDRVVVPA
ncbi:MAG: basic amino acid/polyamine antiporter, family [Solirubrobacteraceae bacterium]|jgi:APA family basic amino acid/polyamine antiporter|nr:basic amino acid/polyamine antiporter, family [Solirubrobacteraceae bacterium]